jgi:uncharacterized radical SAM superfamily protein
MIELYYPGKEFLTVSLTGKRCDLMCTHCKARFLKHMTPAFTPHTLYNTLVKAENDGCKGVLISGGSNGAGKVHVYDFLNTIKNIKNNTKLMINLHTGFIDVNDIEALNNLGIDVISFDVVGSKQAVKNVYGLDLGPGYFETILPAFEEAALNVVPHVTAGLDGGLDSGEERALEIIAAHPPGMVIINSLIPGPGQDLDSHRLFPVLEMASRILPDKTKIGIGCMRPRDIELTAEKLVELRVSSVAAPPRNLKDRLAEAGIEFSERPGCCAFASL